MLKPLIPPLAFMLAIIAQAQATEMLTVECDEPVGVRFEYGDYGTPATKDRSQWKIEINEDRFTGVTPIFLLDENEPQTLVALWGDTKALWGNTKAIPKDPLRVIEAEIVYRSDDLITAVGMFRSDVWLYSLYPKVGWGYFSVHKHKTWLRYASAATFRAKCRFSD